MPVKPIPDGYHSVTPYLIVKGAAAALDFYKSVFGVLISVLIEEVGHTVTPKQRTAALDWAEKWLK